MVPATAWLFLILVKPKLSASSENRDLGTSGYKCFGLRSAGGRSIDSKAKVSLPLATPVCPGPCRIRWRVTKRKSFANEKSAGGLQRNEVGAVWALCLLLFRGACQGALSLGLFLAVSCLIWEWVGSWLAEKQPCP